MGRQLWVWGGKREGGGLLCRLLEGRVLIDVLCTVSRSLGLSAVTVLTARQCYCFLCSLGIKGTGRIKSFPLIQGTPLSQDHVLRLGRCTWTCAPAYLLVRHPMFSWSGGQGVYLCPPGETETSPRPVNCTCSLLGASYKQVPHTSQGHCSQPPLLSAALQGREVHAGYILT